MLRYHVSNKRERQQFEHHTGAIEFGRGPKRNSTARCVIQDLSVSRDHVRIEETSPSQIRVENLSAKNPIRMADNSVIAPGVARDLALPARLTVGETLIDIEAGAADPINRESLVTIAQPMRSMRRASGEIGASLLNLAGGTGGAPTAEVLAHWFETVIEVQKAAAGTNEFYEQTARAMVDLVGLDRGLVLMRRGDSWEPVARSATEGASRSATEGSGGREYSYTILKHVVDEKRTFFQSSASASSTESLQGVEAVVASPIFDKDNNVVGVLYGSRTRYNRARGIGVGPLEAQVVQLLASVIGAGLARREQEADSSRLRVRFEEFFSADLARELEHNPKLLEGQERTVTVMFNDIRGFSTIAQKLGPRESCLLVADVMDRLTDRVREQEGVVVDYMGDGLLAMWNAPAEQPDHAARACRAAIAILNDVPGISAAWKSRTNVPIRIGVGLNTGPALVGNTGSKRKFKYGPLGHAINLASRVESATKQLGVYGLITGSTRDLLDDEFHTRRLCPTKLVGMNDPTDIYELCTDGGSPEWLARRDTYERALACFESQQFHETCATLYPVLANRDGEYDVPCFELLHRAINYLKSPTMDFSPVWILDHK